MANENNTLSQFLYLLMPLVLVRYLSINLNSSRRILWGEHFLTRVIRKSVKLNCSWWTVRECLERAELSHLSSSEKHCLWVLVRSCVFWIVLPKYAFSCSQIWHCHKYITFLDLQFNVFDDFTGMLLTEISLLVFTKGHCKQPGPRHFWSVSILVSVESCLFWTT